MLSSRCNLHACFCRTCVQRQCCSCEQSCCGTGHDHVSWCHIQPCCAVFCSCRSSMQPCCMLMDPPDQPFRLHLLEQPASCVKELTAEALAVNQAWCALLRNMGCVPTYARLFNRSQSLMLMHQRNIPFTGRTSYCVLSQGAQDSLRYKQAATSINKQSVSIQE